MSDRTADILRVEGLIKTYRGRERTAQPLAGVDFSLEEGEILGIVGESGSGKSTLLRVIAGIEPADGGQLFYRDSEYTGCGADRTGHFLQMIFQDAYDSFDPRMTMRRSLLEAAGRGGAASDAIGAILGRFGLEEEHLDRRPAQLSGGQCQRMSIARALLSGARILLCDEITSSLDEASRGRVEELLRSLQEDEGLSMVVVSHDIAFVSGLCDRVLELREGVLTEYCKKVFDF